MRRKSLRLWIRSNNSKERLRAQGIIGSATALQSKYLLRDGSHVDQVSLYISTQSTLSDLFEHELFYQIEISSLRQ